MTNATYDNTTSPNRFMVGAPCRLPFTREQFNPGYRRLSTGTLPLSSRHRALVESPLFGYDTAAMLSRAQEARVRDVLANHPPGTIQTYCLEHLAGASRIASPRHLREGTGCRERLGDGSSAARS